MPSFSRSAQNQLKNLGVMMVIQFITCSNTTYAAKLSWEQFKNNMELQ